MTGAVSVAGHATAQRDTRFEPGCELPFASIEVRRPVDGYCGPEGTAGSAAGRAQNRAKNNFCAPGPAFDLDLAGFRALQQAADDAGIRRAPEGIPSPRWRRKLADIWRAPDGTALGEGSRVRFIGYIDRAFTARVGSGESVNCDLRTPEGNDIHLELGETRSPDDCDRLVTEISPHYRPLRWTPDRLVGIKLAGHPIRVTGQLFWDASHAPCSDGGDDGWRATSWEIHPVYAIEVCETRSLAACRAADLSQWVPLHRWSAASPADDTDEAEVQPDP